jgi:hypothetical protein
LALSACTGGQDVAGVEVGVTTFGGWVPSDLCRFLPLAVFLTCLAEMVLLPTRFFFASAILILLSKDAEDTCDTTNDRAAHGVSPKLDCCGSLSAAYLGRAFA